MITLPVRILVKVFIEITVILRYWPQIMLIGIKLTMFNPDIAIVRSNCLTGLKAMCPPVQNFVCYFPSDDILTTQAFHCKLTTALVTNHLSEFILGLGGREVKSSIFSKSSANTDWFDCVIPYRCIKGS